MKKSILTSLFSFFICSFSLFNIQAQSTGERVYTIFQTHCSNAGCHNTADAMSNLDLQGIGTNPMLDVYNKIYQEQPSNTAAKDADFQLIYPGDPYRSSIFRYLNNGLAGDVDLLDLEDAAGIHAGIEVSDVEKEMVRQWIVFGAPSTGEVIDPDLIEEFYAGNGIWASDPQNPPAKPNPSEGFQIHLGPIFLEPSDLASGLLEDVEYLSKYYLPEYLGDVEVKEIETHIGSSHHFIIYEFTDQNAANNMAYGLRGVNHDNVVLVDAYQESRSTVLPKGTAFRWQKGTALDLNAHVINYTNTSITATDVFINVYTQEYGTAAQKMNVQLLPNFGISIPNDGELETEETSYVLSFLPQQIHVWQMTSHTHKYGKSFDVWLRNSNGTKGDHIFSASKYNGIPECETIDYDYLHPPTRTFSPFLPLRLSEGLIHQASYMNDGPRNVSWGATADDEMMITVISYVTSLNGIELPDASVCFAEEITDVEEIPVSTSSSIQLSLQPNPSNHLTTLHISSPMASMGNLTIYDMVGRQIQVHQNISFQRGMNNELPLDVSNLDSGIYLLQLEDENGEKSGVKMVVGTR
ncbi:MAG: T9SS type A sorting domain-containing protein [Chitinophagales bacterium]